MEPTVEPPPPKRPHVFSSDTRERQQDEWSKPSKSKGRVKFNDQGPLDPMDPASYSDVPR